MLQIITQILLIILLITQIFVLLHMAYINYKRNKEDKIFWDKIHKELDKSIIEYTNLLDSVDNIEKDYHEEDK